jgi:hypothetical protein
MKKVDMTAIGLLVLCLCGCPESTSESPKTRTGSVGGVTSQDIDDMAKPDSKPKDGKGAGGGFAP